jgi:hypothetical protein
MSYAKLNSNGRIYLMHITKQNKNGTKNQANLSSATHKSKTKSRSSLSGEVHSQFRSQAQKR